MAKKPAATDTSPVPTKPVKPAIELATIPTEAWSWNDEADYSMPAPTVKTSPSSVELPFKAWFAKEMPQALSGKQPSKFVPMRFFVARSTTPEKVTLGQCRSKVRDQFTKWLGTQPEAIQKSIDITFAARTGREPGFTEPGIQFWLLSIKQPEAKPPEVKTPETA